jgi:hypothetical protein
MVAAVSPPGAAGAAATIIASFHNSPSRALPLAAGCGTSAGAPRRYNSSGACCFAAAKPTPAAAVAAELEQDDEGVNTNGADPKPPTRKKRRSRKGKKSAAALEEEEEAKRKAEEEAAAAKKKAEEEESRAATAGLDLDEVISVSPVGLGRRSRQLFDEVWRKFSRLGQMSSASVAEALVEEEQAVLSRGGPMCEFTVPGAQDTTVLVVGATSRIGRIVVRKLMLRGYNVKVTSLLLGLLPPLCLFCSIVFTTRIIILIRYN